MAIYFSSIWVKDKYERLLLTILSLTSLSSCISRSIWWEISYTCVTQSSVSIWLNMWGFQLVVSNEYSHWLERWVGPTYLLPFQVSVDMFVLGLEGWTAMICIPFLWVKPNSSSKFPDYIWAHPHTTHSTLCSCSTEHTPQIIWSIQNAPTLLFTLQQLKMRSESWIRGPLPQVFPYHSFSHQLSFIKSIFPFRCHDLSIVKCYEEIAEDLTLLCLFPLEKYSYIQALPCLGCSLI